MTRRRAVIYCRISVTSEESVSIERQEEAARQYCAARSWDVLDVFLDDGVSASRTRPEQREGWSGLLKSNEQYDAVIVWKVDRLARSTLDFLHAHEALQERGAGLVCVENPIDMTTAEGKAFATMLSVFAEMEAAAISARVAAARTHLLKAGRVVGGVVPYGWKSVKNPAGPGFLLAKDDTPLESGVSRIGWIEKMAERTRAGKTIYSTTEWLTEQGAPTATGVESWGYSTVERLLRNPVLAGMTLFNPGNKSAERGSEVLRGDDGLPIVLEHLAIMTPARWRGMVKALDDREQQSSRALPRSRRAKTSGAWSGLLYCNDLEKHPEPVRMHRGTTQGRAGQSCPECFQVVSSFEPALTEEFLRLCGDRPRWSVIEDVYEGGAALLPEIEHRLGELAAELTDADEARSDEIVAQMRALKERRAAARAEPVVVRQESEPVDFFENEWARAEDDEERRAVLGDAVERVLVGRGRPGRRTKAQLLARFDFVWRPGLMG